MSITLPLKKLLVNPSSCKRTTKNRAYFARLNCQSIKNFFGNSLQILTLISCKVWFKSFQRLMGISHSLIFFTFFILPLQFWDRLFGHLLLLGNPNGFLMRHCIWMDTPHCQFPVLLLQSLLDPQEHFHLIGCM